jgi:carbon-monoxide dehydrogenase medium subunit
MFPADFAYARARSLDEALDLLDEAAADGEEAKLIAGGQSLLPMMKLRLAAPQVLIDIADLKELNRGGFCGDSHTVGALTTYRQLSRQRFVSRDGAPALVNGASSLVGGAPALADALAVLADPQVRARGTIGGAVAHGDPAADLPAVLLALNAELTIASRKGRHEETRPQRHIACRQAEEASNVGKRVIPLDDFLQGIYTTDLAEDEIITHIRINTQGARASAYEKFPHPASHLPLAGVCAVVRLRDGLIDSAEVAVTGISPRPYRAGATEKFLNGIIPTPGSLAAAAAQVTMDLHPQGSPHVTVTAGSPGTGTGKRSGQVTLLGDHHASGDYRAHLAEVLTRRALARAIARAGAA